MATIEQSTPTGRLPSVDTGSKKDELRDYRPEPCDEHLHLAVITEDDAELWDRTERFVYDVYRETGFCRESPRGWVEETDPYRAGTTFHVILSEDEAVVGAIRTLVGRYADLPIGQFAATIEVPAEPIMELGSLAVSADQRGLGVANELHRSAVQEAIRREMPAFCMLVEPWSVEFFREVYGVPLVLTAPPKDYMGSLTVAAIADLDATLNAELLERPGVFSWLTEGLEPELWASGRLPILLP